MERYETARESAVRHLKVADHVFTMTYPLVNDPKLLKLVLKDIYLAVQETITVLLHYERLYKKIPVFNENFESMLQILPGVFAEYKISNGYVNFLRDIKEVYQKQQESDVEFVRKEHFVFATKDYDLSLVSTKEIKDYLAKTKLFMQEVLEVVEKNERLNGKC